MKKRTAKELDQLSKAMNRLGTLDRPIGAEVSALLLAGILLAIVLMPIIILK